MALEAVVHGRQPLHEAKERVEVGFARAHVDLPSDIGVRPQSTHVLVDISTVIAQVGDLLQHLVELRLQQELVHPQRAEAAAVAQPQFARNEQRETWHVGTLKTIQELAQQVVRHLRRQQCSETAIRQTVERV